MENLRKASISYWEILDEARIKLNRSRIDALNQLKSSFNLSYTLHAPFVDINIASFNPYIRRAAIKQLEKSLYHASLLGCQIWTLHAGFYPHLKVIQRAYRISLNSIRYLAKKARDLGLTIALENGSADFNNLFVKVKDFEAYLQELKAYDNVKICFDVGHANTVNEVDKFLKHLLGEIAHVHVHDNHGSFDEHLPILEGSVNWEKLLAELLRLGFKGVVVVETMKNPLKSVQKLKELKSRIAQARIR